jgi:hypothetical protein
LVIAPQDAGRVPDRLLFPVSLPKTKYFISVIALHVEGSVPCIRWRSNRFRNRIFVMAAKDEGSVPEIIGLL